MKKNGTLSNDPRKLTLIDSAGSEIFPHSDLEDAATDYLAASLTEDADSVAGSSPGISRSALILVVVSVACAAAAITAGSYAVWLTRRQAARNALTDVRDLLRTCQERMGQMEEDLHRLPHSARTSPAS